jgi:hypothetical protein
MMQYGVLSNNSRLRFRTVQIAVAASILACTAGIASAQECGYSCCSGGTVCYCYPYPGSCDCLPGTPIVIDLKGDGFDLTNAIQGVMFDLGSTGHKVQVAWTAIGSDDAWLVLDRNGNGRIDNGSEMFGNLTPQPASDDPNGFLALAVFDTPEYGGNGDGIIDEHDAIFAKLRVWTDSNHNGISEPWELHTLAEAGIKAISLEYGESGRVDKWGNRFRYRAKVSFIDGTSRWAYDVFLQINH